MDAGLVRRVAAIAIVCSALGGCTATEKSSGKPGARMRMPALPLIGKGEDELLRKAVENDPFPRAHGALAAANAEKPAAR
jgi:hypothetical protein